MALRSAPDAGGARGALAGHVPAMLAIAAATLSVELGVFLLARAIAAPLLQTALVTLGAAVLWTALAAPAFAAARAGPDWLGSFLRAGTVADSGGVVLIVLWLTCPAVTLASAVKAYCILAGVAMFGAAAVCAARSRAGRSAAAVAAAGVLLVCLASPFWVGGAARSTDRPFARRALAAAVWINPFYALTDTLDVRGGFVWHRHGELLYSRVEGGYFGPAPPACWYASVLIDLAAAAVLVAGALLRRVVFGRAGPPPAGRAVAPPDGAAPGRDG